MTSVNDDLYEIFAARLMIDIEQRIDGATGTFCTGSPCRLRLRGEVGPSSFLATSGRMINPAGEYLEGCSQGLYKTQSPLSARW